MAALLNFSVIAVTKTKKIHPGGRLDFKDTPFYLTKISCDSKNAFGIGFKDKESPLTVMVPGLENIVGALDCTSGKCELLQRLTKGPEQYHARALALIGTNFIVNIGPNAFIEFQENPLGEEITVTFWGYDRVD
jgi:hypothetical protein